MRGVAVSMYFIKSFLMYSSFVCIVCHGKRIRSGYKGSSFDGKPFPLQQLDSADEFEISSASSDGSVLSDRMIFQYDGVNISSSYAWRLTRLWSSVEITVQSDNREFEMEIYKPHHIAHKSAHHREPNDGLQYTQDLHNVFVYTIHYILDALWYFISNHDVSNNKYIKINPIGQHFVKVCYHGSKTTNVFTISVKESIIDYRFPLCLSFGALLLVFANPWARNINFLYGTSYNIAGILLSPFTSVLRACKKIENVQVYFIVLTGTWSLIVLFILWMIENNWYYKSSYSIISVALKIVMGSTKYKQRHLDERITFTRFNWIGGIVLILSATQLLEFSVILSIITYICVKYPTGVYSFIRNSVTRSPLKL